MGRNFIIKKEPVTSLSAYVIDSMLLEDFQTGKESKTDALRRIFISFFGEDRIKEKRRELQKKLDRQLVSHGKTGDQETIDTMYFPKHTIKDIEYDKRELVQTIVEAKHWGTNLANRTADDSIIRAIKRGDCEQTETGKYVIIKRWF